MGNTQSDSSSIIHQGKVVKKSEEIVDIPFRVSTDSPGQGGSKVKDKQAGLTATKRVSEMLRTFVTV